MALSINGTAEKYFTGAGINGNRRKLGLCASGLEIPRRTRQDKTKVVNRMNGRRI